MTPIIDIVFLLIIFFLVVCQFVEAENFPVTVPDKCDAARTTVEPGLQLTTVTVMRDSSGQIIYAVGSDTLDQTQNTSTDKLTTKLANLIDIHIENMPAEKMIVILRVDKDIQYGAAQYALAAIAQSSATDVQMAVVQGENTIDSTNLK